MTITGGMAGAESEKWMNYFWTGCMHMRKTENVVHLDALTINLRSCLVELGYVLHDVIVSRSRHMDEEELVKLIEI